MFVNYRAKVEPDRIPSPLFLFLYTGARTALPIDLRRFFAALYIFRRIFPPRVSYTKENNRCKSALRRYTTDVRTAPYSDDSLSRGGKFPPWPAHPTRINIPDARFPPDVRGPSGPGEDVVPLPACRRLFSRVSHEDFQANLLSNGGTARAAPHGRDWALQVRCEIDTTKPLRLISVSGDGKRSRRPLRRVGGRGETRGALPRDVP